MEGTKPRTVSSLGMFDLLKGIGMLAIVFAHTAELYPLGTNDVTPGFAASHALCRREYRQGGDGNPLGSSRLLPGECLYILNINAEERL